MRTTLIVAATLAAVVSAGCLRAGPPKTPNQREVERDARERTTRGADATPPAIKR
jgi:hypothetical protein